MTEAFSGLAITGSLLLLLYLIIGRSGDGWQIGTIFLVGALCWKWWARFMKWFHHD